MKVVYTRNVFIILNNTKEVLEYNFEDFMYRISSGNIDVNNIDFITQEGDVAVKELQTRGGHFLRK